MSKSPAPRKMPGGVIAPQGRGGKGGGGKGGKSPRVMPGGRIKTPHQHHKRAHQKKPPRRFPGGVIAPKHPKAKRHPKRGLAGAAAGGWWITGGNDQLGNCAAVAVANSLLLSSGLRIPDAELLRLHDRAGPLSIPEALAALGARFAELRPGDWARDGAVAGLATPHGPHAALILGGHLVTWGGVMDWPESWDLDEAWSVAWPS